MSINKNFVIRHGLEVYDDLIFADPDSENVGIGSTIPGFKLDVRGSIGSTDLVVSGVATIGVLGVGTISVGTISVDSISGTIGTIANLNATNATIENLSGTLGTITTFESTDSTIENLNFVSGVGTNLNVSGIATFNAIQIDGLLTAGSSIGAEDQYLRHTGTGVTWVNLQRSVVETDSQTATEGQDVFYTDYTVDLVEVYLNGIRLNSNEFTATDASTITLGTPAYEGDCLDFVKYNPFNEYPTFFWLSGAGEEIYYMDNVGIGTTDPNAKLHVVGDLNLDDGGTYNTTLQVVTPTTNRVISLPDATGIVALVAGSSGQVTYNQSGINTGDAGFTYSSSGGLVLTTNLNATGISTLGVTSTTDLTAQQLNVSGVATVGSDFLVDSGTLYVDSTNNRVGINTLNPTQSFQVGAGGTNTVVVVTGIGSVGIGTTNPTNKLDVIGDVKIGINTSQGVILTSPNGTQYRLIVDNSGSLSTVAV